MDIRKLEKDLKLLVQKRETYMKFKADGMAEGEDVLVQEISYLLRQMKVYRFYELQEVALLILAAIAVEEIHDRVEGIAKEDYIAATSMGQSAVELRRAGVYRRFAQELHKEADRLPISGWWLESKTEKRLKAAYYDNIADTILDQASLETDK